MDGQNTTAEKKKPKRWQKAFLSALAVNGNVTSAAKAARVNRQAVYRVRDEDEAFAALWEEALAQAGDSLEEEAIRRARDGVNEPVIYQGELCGLWVDEHGTRVDAGTPGASFLPLTVKKYSDTLLIFLLKGHKPDKFRENFTHEHSGPGGGSIPHAHGLSDAAALAALKGLYARLGAGSGSADSEREVAADGPILGGAGESDE
jgi:hypothetical protein